MKVSRLEKILKAMFSGDSCISDYEMAVNGKLVIDGILIDDLCVADEYDAEVVEIREVSRFDNERKCYLVKNGCFLVGSSMSPSTFLETYSEFSDCDGIKYQAIVF